MIFVQLVVQEKSGGQFDGKTGAAAAADAWDRFVMICEECDD